MKPEELIAVEQISRGVWCINGQEIVWDHFPKGGITGYDRRNNQALITPELWSRQPKELVAVTITGMSYAYQESNQRKFWLSRRQFIVYFLGIPGSPAVLRFRDDLIQKHLERDLFQPLYSLCE